MQHDPLRSESSIDKRTADEALALAVRLQQEYGDRVSMDELQRTADEAGIDRVYLESAIHRLTAEQSVPLESVRLRTMLLAMAVSVAFVLLLTVSASGQPRTFAPIVPLLIALFAAAIASRIVRKRRLRRARHRFRNML